MTHVPHALILDLVESLALRPRPYAEVMEAWRTTCPGLSVWEDALDAGYVAREWRKGRGEMITITPRGRALLSEYGRVTPERAAAAHAQQTRAPDR